MLLWDSISNGNTFVISIERELAEREVAEREVAMRIVAFYVSITS